MAEKNLSAFIGNKGRKFSFQCRQDVFWRNVCLDKGKQVLHPSISVHYKVRLDKKLSFTSEEKKHTTETPTIRIHPYKILYGKRDLSTEYGNKQVNTERWALIRMP